MTPIQSAWHHIRRSPFQSLIAFVFMTMTFLICTVFLVLTDGLSSVLRHFETKPEITIFLKDGLDRAVVESLQKELANYPNIREIRFISKEKALGLYRERNKDNPMLTEMVTASILPASFEVSVTDPSVLEQISVNFSAKTSQIDEIIYQKDIIQTLLSWTGLIRRLGFAAVSFLIVISFLVLSVIIGMKITNRKEEIRISRLLGASRFYVKKPFLFEGLGYGLFGSFFGSSVGFGLALYFSSRINFFFQPVEFIRSDIRFYLLIALGQLLFGSLFGYLSSWFGVKRYIRF